MKKFIFRKPKFMRNDELMQKYIDDAHDVLHNIELSNMITDEEYEMYTLIRVYLKKAAKAGGFFRMKDFFRWMESQDDILMKFSYIG